MTHHILGRPRPNECWFQINGEAPEQPMQIELACEREPKLMETPVEGLTLRQWDPNRKMLKIVLSHARGAVEVEVLE
jgi:hypothetical protein